MNYLVYLDRSAGELERILNGVKTMLVKEFDPEQTNALQVRPGDTLYFLRNNNECALHVKASVVRVLSITKNLDEGLSSSLKEMQSKLQFTEQQFDYWSGMERLQLIEFESARKIDVIHITPKKIAGGSAWIAFEEFNDVTE